MNDDATSRARAVLQPCSSEDESQPQGTTTTHQVVDQENDDYISRAYAILSGEFQEVRIPSQEIRPGDSMEGIDMECPSDRGEVSENNLADDAPNATSTDPQDDMLLDMDDCKPPSAHNSIEHSTFIASKAIPQDDKNSIAPPTKSIHREPSTKVTPLTSNQNSTNSLTESNQNESITEVTPVANNQTEKETFWICSHCNYNVNSLENDCCIYCSANRAGVASSEGIDDNAESEEKGGVDSWSCGKCDNWNTHSKFRCKICKAWRDWKRPVKKWVHRKNPKKMKYGVYTTKNQGHSRAKSLQEDGLVSPLVAKKELIRHNMKKAGEKITCRCNKSQCLKLYCDCFRNGKVCRSKECGCSGCKNTVSNSTPHGIRTKAIKAILKRRPDAFEKRQKIDEGCKCKNNKCLKKYCVCYNVGLECDKNKCQCLDCLNRPGRYEDAEGEEKVLEESEELQVKKWTCTKCSQPNSKSKCVYCEGSKDGKRPVKIEYSPSKGETKKPPPRDAARKKKELKPQFEVNERIYAPWWPDTKQKNQPASTQRNQQTWQPGVVMNYTIKKYCEYGEIRHYDIRYEDGSKMYNIEDFCVFSREDYLLQAGDDEEKEWTGVKNVLDETSRDNWARIIGWYEATIDGKKYSFARLSDALRAYNVSVLDNKGRKAKSSSNETTCEVKSSANETAFETKSSSKSNLKEEKSNSKYSPSYKGVYLDNRNEKYIAYIKLNKRHHLGNYIMATDAALAYDKCVHQLDISSSMNFKTLSEYSNARKKEAAERGVNVARSEVHAYLTLKVNNVISGDINDVEAQSIENRVKSEEVCEFDDNMKDTTVENDLGQADLRSLETHGSRSPCMKYNGVFWHKTANKYIAQCQHKGKTHYFGTCDLAADAALMYDRCITVLKGPDCAKVNFASDTEYSNSRVQESAGRHMKTPCADVLALIEEKVHKVLTEVGRNNVGRSADDSASMTKRSSRATGRQHDIAVIASNANFAPKRTSPTASSPDKNGLNDSTSSASQRDAARIGSLQPHLVRSNRGSVTERHTPNIISPDRSTLIMLISDQTESLRFPVGALVWWSINDMPESENSAGTYNEGKVNAVHLDVASHNMVYEVAPKHETALIRLSENDLAFAPSCPLFISPHLAQYRDQSAQDLLDEGESLLRGHVLFCKRVDKTWMYTVTIQNEAGFNIYEHIPSSNVTFRKASSA